MSILAKLSATQVVTLYNIFAKQNKVPEVKKFSSKTKGNEMLQNITRGLDRKLVVAAMKKAKIPAELIKLLPEEAKVVAIPVTPEALPAPIKKIDAKKVLEEAATKETARQAKVDSKEAAGIRKEIRLTDQASEVFGYLRKELTKDTELSSTDVAKGMKTSTNAVIDALEKLAKLKLISIEDDSADDKHRLFYVTLTKAGREFNLAPKSTSSTPKKMPAERPGPSSPKNGKKIFKLVDGNPRREGTHGYKSFALIKDGMTYEQYKAAGGRNNDLQWDIDHKFIELRDK